MWRAIPGFEGHYEASDDGQVRSLTRMVRHGSFMRKSEGRVLKPILHAGYLWVTLAKDGRGRRHSIHRLVLLTFRGAPEDGHEGCHSNGDPLDNRLSNLRWDTRSANMRDRIAHGCDPQASKTHCPQGHPYNEANTRISKGGRHCRICNRAAVARSKARRNAVTA